MNTLGEIQTGDDSEAKALNLRVGISIGSLHVYFSEIPGYPPVFRAEKDRSSFRLASGEPLEPQQPINDYIFGCLQRTYIRA